MGRAGPGGRRPEAGVHAHRASGSCVLGFLSHRFGAGAGSDGASTAPAVPVDDMPSVRFVPHSGQPVDRAAP